MDIKTQLIEISEPHINDEICGFIHKSGDDFVFKSAKNRSPSPDEFFYISSIDFLKAKEDNLVAIFHNHCEGTEEPSSFDLIMTENTCFPAVIYSNLTKKFGVFVPKYIDWDVKDIEGLREQLND